MSRRTLFLALAIGVLVGAGSWRLLRQPAPSDEERIRALFDRAARAAEEKRVADVVEPVSERFQGGGLDRRGVKQLVAFQVLRGEWVSAAISGARIRVLDDGAQARANVDVVLARGAGKGKALESLLPGEASVHRIACRLEREEGDWKIVEATWTSVGLAEAITGPVDP
jgi:hypothetical protein